MLNDYQRIVLHSYAEGDYAELEDGLDTSRNISKDLEGCGDDLFQLLMVELSTSEGCKTYEEALGRIHAIVRDVLVVQGALAHGRKQYDAEE